MTEQLTEPPQEETLEVPLAELRPALDAVLMVADQPLDHLTLATAVGYPDGRAHTQQLRPTAEGLRTASPVREADETPAGVGLGRQGDEPGGGRAPW